MNTQAIEFAVEVQADVAELETLSLNELAYVGGGAGVDTIG
jgi:hypothetical protein